MFNVDVKFITKKFMYVHRVRQIDGIMSQGREKRRGEEYESGLQYKVLLHRACLFENCFICSLFKLLFQEMFELLPLPAWSPAAINNMQKIKISLGKAGETLDILLLCYARYIFTTPSFERKQLLLFSTHKWVVEVSSGFCEKIQHPSIKTKQICVLVSKIAEDPTRAKQWEKEQLRLNTMNCIIISGSTLLWHFLQYTYIIHSKCKIKNTIILKLQFSYWRQKIIWGEEKEWAL